MIWAGSSSLHHHRVVLGHEMQLSPCCAHLPSPLLVLPVSVSPAMDGQCVLLWASGTPHLVGGKPRGQEGFLKEVLSE